METNYEEPLLIVAGSDGNKIFGRLLRDLRRLNSARTKDLANAAEVSESFITGIERGAQAPTMTKAKIILSCMTENHGYEFKEDGPYDLWMYDPDSNKNITFRFKAKIRGQNSRPLLTSHGGFWIVYHSDFSNFVIFDLEIEALRHAVNNSMLIKRLRWGQGRTELVKGE